MNSARFLVTALLAVLLVLPVACDGGGAEEQVYHHHSSTGNDTTEPSSDVYTPEAVPTEPNPCEGDINWLDGRFECCGPGGCSYYNCVTSNDTSTCSLDCEIIFAPSLAKAIKFGTIQLNPPTGFKIVLQGEPEATTCTATE